MFSKGIHQDGDKVMFDRVRVSILDVVFASLVLAFTTQSSLCFVKQTR